MYCPTCNTPNRDDAKFCKNCGHPLHGNTGVQSLVSTPVSASAQENVEPQSIASAPPPGNVGEQSPVPDAVSNQTNAESIQDISNAPTEILSPEKMAALHNRIWQQEQEREPQDSQETFSESQVAQGGTANGSIEIPTGQSTPPSSSMFMPEQQAQDIADMPTARMTSSQEDENIPIPPPPPSQTDMTSAPAEATQTAPATSPSQSSEAETQEPNGTMQQASSSQSEQSGQASVVAPLAGAMHSSGVMQSQPQTSPAQSEQPEQMATSPAGDFLPVGTIMQGRYEVAQVVSQNPQENVYQVIDRQGYQHCWNCGSEQNTAGDEFCIDCGASMLNVPYIMHEYGSTGIPSTNSQSDAHVLQGNIVNTFIEQGRTYMIEQPQVTQSTFPNGVHLLAACDSDAGDVRRSEPNEDSTLVLQLSRVHESMAVPLGVFIVADGLGGHDNGQLASRVTINIIAERMVRELLDAPLASEKEGKPANLPDEDGLVAMFHGAIEDANTTLVQMNQHDKTDMGSTITGFMIAGDHAYIINVGDSRTYMLRSKQLYQKTTDHSLVGQLVAGGLIEPDEVYTHPQRSQIFRSLGDKPNVQIDVFKQQLHPGDILLSCSDGLWEMVRDPQIESILNDAPDPQTACTQLIEAANKNGGEDNVSAVLVYVR